MARLMTVMRHVREGLESVGERTGQEWLLYNPLTFMHFHRHAKRLAPPVIATIHHIFPDAHRMVDVGAGSGAYAANAKRIGKDVVALERGSVGRLIGKRQGVDVRQFDLVEDPPAELDGTFDLAYCFEVAEHLPPELGDELVEFIAGLAPNVVFTAARPGQGGTGHINEQPPEYWIERFARSGLSHSRELSDALATGFRATGVDAAYLNENVMVFQRNDNGAAPRPPVEQ
jgi:SAM-dependent methyltransferase